MKKSGAKRATASQKSGAKTATALRQGTPKAKRAGSRTAKTSARTAKSGGGARAKRGTVSGTTGSGKSHGVAVATKEVALKAAERVAEAQPNRHSGRAHQVSGPRYNKLVRALGGEIDQINLADVAWRITTGAGHEVDLAEADQQMRMYALIALDSAPGVEVRVDKREDREDESADAKGTYGVYVLVDAKDERPADDVEAAPSIEKLIQAFSPKGPIPTAPMVWQAQRNAEAQWELITEFGALTSEDLGKVHSRADNVHALASRWKRDGDILAVENDGRQVFPGFQFDGDLKPLPVIAEVLEALPRDEMSEWEVALWFTAANGWLASRRPVDVMHEDPELVVAAAEHLAEPIPL